MSESLREVALEMMPSALGRPACAADVMDTDAEIMAVEDAPVPAPASAVLMEERHVHLLPQPATQSLDCYGGGRNH
jgi:hypothetical protein